MHSQLNPNKEGNSKNDALTSNLILPLIEESLSISAPAWPLQNAVAVNPFWFLRHKTFDMAIREASTAIQTPLMMPLSFYQEKVSSGVITPSSIERAFNSARNLWPDLPETVNQLAQTVTTENTAFPQVKSFADYADANGSWASRVVAELGKYAAAYLDDKQTLVPFPLINETFWTAWVKMQEFDQSMDIWGARGFQAFASAFNELDSVQSISLIMSELGLNYTSQKMYLQRLIASVLGWSTQFKYLEWQRSLGYSTNRMTSTADLLAVRLAYDYALYTLTRRSNLAHAKQWLRDLEICSEKHNFLDPSPSFQLQYVYQLAWELSYQQHLIGKIESSVSHRSCRPNVQMVFCIDVRSETIRRHIETLQPTIQTIGFAGFFGLPFDFHFEDESQANHRLPVLLAPSFVLEEKSHPDIKKKNSKSTSKLDYSIIGGYFRNLRKNSLSSFAYVELFGAFYFKNMLHRLWLNLVNGTHFDHLPARFYDRKVFLDHKTLRKPDGEAVQTDEKVLRVASILRHMGLTTRFAQQVWIVGHGSATSNNPFGSSLDCGACGGHAGDINARLLVSLLNDSDIRAGLREQKIEIPERTVFIAAIHETVTDEIYPLDLNHIPHGALNFVQKTHEIIKTASRMARQERQHARSDILDPKTNRRTQNWSEVRPEWGLTGNACLIIAPRERTKSINLNSRSFLHDYDWRKDEESGYQTLELIMTAPMVVTNWINLQYYASTVAPGVYGAGNKVLHNLTNETGVVEGNGGDLRVGLPMQSIHDGLRFIHDPLRLSVFIEAPQSQIENVIQKHQTVRELIENEWLHLLHIDSATRKITRRLRIGTYT